jgi:hypothetical protein
MDEERGEVRHGILGIRGRLLGDRRSVLVEIGHGTPPVIGHRSIPPAG